MVKIQEKRFLAVCLHFSFFRLPKIITTVTFYLNISFAIIFIGLCTSLSQPLYIVVHKSKLLLRILLQIVLQNRNYWDLTAFYNLVVCGMVILLSLLTLLITGRYCGNEVFYHTIFWVMIFSPSLLKVRYLCYLYQFSC